MTFSDSDWTRDPPRTPRLPAAQRRALVLAVAIAAGCVAIALVFYGIERWVDAQGRARALQAGRARALPIVTAPSGIAPASAPAAPAPTRVELPDDRHALAELEAEMRQRAREAAEQAAIEGVRRKERAWERFYQRPAFCNENPTSAQMIECANDYIRMRRQFEERWGTGRP